MKSISPFLILLMCLIISTSAQDQPISPSVILTGTYLGETPPLRDIPPMTDAEWQEMVEKAEKKVLNPKLRERAYPFAETALPKGPDPVWQRQISASRATRAPILNFNGTDSPYFPPDANGSVGPNHYMQTINTVYTIYTKSGTLVAGPTALNTLFSGVTGSNYNDGDPIVLFDEQADRWLVVEFSVSGPNDYMLVAISTTNDPTGTWHKYSFDVADMPDYPKFGVWRDGYYMGTNNASGADIYVFERSQMLVGGTAQMVGFDNPWRPKSGFVCVPPVDNDGTFAPEGTPGIFIAAYDDAWGGGADQLWIYELAVNWTTPGSSTFTRTQQINVAPFDANFGTSWDNIVQPGTSQKLDAVPEVIMNPPQYRNFGSYQTIVCCHSVDVDATDHAGIRWYELRNTGGTWSIRQQSTFAPDEHSRWMGSIMLNGNNEIALGYSISSSTVYPGIRFTGQSATAYAAATGAMDIPEEIIHTGIYAQSSYNRWGDYSGLQVDPTNDATFWYTNQYVGPGNARKTKIATFEIPDAPFQWTGEISNVWNNPANWTGGQVPGNADQVFIPASATNWPAFTGNLVIGTHCDDVYLMGSSQMEISGDLTVNAGKKLIVMDNGEISIDGNWTNNGTFSSGSGTVIFTGSGQASVALESTASILNYVRTTFTKGMTPLSGAVIGPTGDDAAVNVPIGFTFNYAGSAYTQARLCTNGWISLDLTGGTANNNANLFSGAVPNTTLAPWFDDLLGDNTSVISYKTEGSAPDRVFTAEWYQVKTYYTNPTKARISFQVKLFESADMIEFHYGNLVSGNHSSGESASIGLEDATGGSGHFIEATTGSNTVGITTLISTTDWPAVNYRFTPEAPTQVFHHLNLNNPGGNLNFDVNTRVLGDFTIMPVGAFTVTQGKLLEIAVP